MLFIIMALATLGLFRSVCRSSKLDIPNSRPASLSSGVCMSLLKASGPKPICNLSKIAPPTNERKYQFIGRALYLSRTIFRWDSLCALGYSLAPLRGSIANGMIHTRFPHGSRPGLLSNAPPGLIADLMTGAPALVGWDGRWGSLAGTSHISVSHMCDRHHRKSSRQAYNVPIV